MEDCYLGKATERIFLPLLQMQNPEIINYNFPLEGVFHNCVIVSIEKRFPGHARKVMNALWGIGQMMYTKMLIVVDADVDPYDLEAVAAHVFSHANLAEDLIGSIGALDALDHAANKSHYGGKLGIDGTRKFKEEIDEAQTMTENEFKMVNAPFGQLATLQELCPFITGAQVIFSQSNHDLLVVSVTKEDGHRTEGWQKTVMELDALKQGKVLLFLDEVEELSDLSKVAWRVFNNIDASRDLLLVDDRLGVDATRKRTADGHPREWPDDIVMSNEIKELVDRKWASYGID
jgi:4-hydroxy-3-polyprenylbenzoate decarboxylase